MPTALAKKIMSLRVLATLLVTTLLVAPCASGPSDEEQACAAYAEQLCRLGQACFPESFDRGWGDVATCGEVQTIECKRRLAARGTKETAAATSSCAEGLATISCDGVLPAACFVANGTLPNNTQCVFGSQCQGGSCWQMHPAFCGICTDASPEGGGCITSDNCASPLECRFGTCFRPGSLGKGASCGEMLPRCQFPLVCLGDDKGVPGTCSDPLQHGFGCAGSPHANQCDQAKGLVCDAGTKACRPFVPRPRPGEPCATNACNGSATCGPDLICYRLPRQGESCEVGGMDCLPPAACMPTSAGEKCVILDVAQCE